MPETPPARYRIPYYLFGMRIPIDWRDWLEAHVARVRFPWEEIARRQGSIALIWVLMKVVLFPERGAPLLWFGAAWLGLMTLTFLMVPLFSGALRRQVLRSHERKWRRQSGGGWNEGSRSHDWREEIGRGV